MPLTGYSDKGKFVLYQIFLSICLIKVIKNNMLIHLIIKLMFIYQRIAYLWLINHNYDKVLKISQFNKEALQKEKI